MTADDVRQAWREFALSCTAHRLRKFGFESHINHYSPDELRILAQMMPPMSARALLVEAERKSKDAA